MTASADDPVAVATERQRLAADPRANVWVSASAGSGKTKVLTDRVLSLLLAGVAPSRILCLTFTRAAAAEMANRINDRLGAWAAAAESGLAKELTDLTGAPPDDETALRARRLFAGVLDAPGGLRIQTIHAFCESLLGRFPLEAGVAPHFRVMDERDAAEALAAARERVLDRPTAVDGDPLGQALADVVALADETRFEALLVSLAKERGRFARALERHGGIDGLTRAIFAAYGTDPEATDAGLVDTACEEASFDGVALRAAAETMCGSSKKTDCERGATIAAWLAEPERRRERFDGYLRAYFTQQGVPFKTPATKESAAALPALEREAARLVAVVEARAALAVARAGAGLARLADAILAAYQAHKDAAAELDYDDLILITRRLLERDGGVSWVHYKLDEGIAHVLVDEAQDTNPDQWAVVRALTSEYFAGEGAQAAEARTVFAVGDAKQSIFSFQRADPAAFAEMRAAFARAAHGAGRVWRDVALDVSFRSVGAVLETVDAVFSDADARAGVAGSDEPVRHSASRRGQPGRVELWPLAEPEEADEPEPWAPPVAPREAAAPRERLALALARRIHGWILGGTHLESRGRAIRAGDVMVLVPRRTPFVEALVRALKERNVPVAGVDRMVLTDQLAVMDLVALGQFLLLPDDDLTLATVLRGPLVGLSEEALFALAAGRGERSLWARLRAAAGDDRAFAAAHALLAELLARADYTPPYDLYADLLGRLGGRRRLIGRLGVEAGDPIDELLARAEAYERLHPPSLQGFLHWLARGRAEIKRDLEHGGRDEVRIMTVHGAKGLEAPIVVLADAFQGPPRRHGVLWTGDGLPLWSPRADLAPAPLPALREAAERAAEEEYRRLLYVALTRAEDRLIVCGWRSGRAETRRSWYEMARAGLAGLAAPEAFDGADGGPWSGESLVYATEAQAPPDRPPAGPPAAAEAEALPAWARRPAPPEPVRPRPLAPSRPEAAEPAVASPLGEDGGAALRRGILVHALLERLPELPPGERRAAARSFLSRPAHGLDAAAAEALAEETLAVIDAPEFAPLFGPGSRAEVALAGVVADRVVSGRVDRLVVRERRVDVVDYKTGRAPPDGPESVPEAYLRQMAAYRALLAQIFENKEISCALLWTSGPRMTALPAALLDRWLA